MLVPDPFENKKQKLLLLRKDRLDVGSMPSVVKGLDTGSRSFGKQSVLRSNLQLKTLPILVLVITIYRYEPALSNLFQILISL